MRSPAFAFLVVSLSASAAASQVALPSYDVNDRCDRGFHGEGNRLGRGFCLSREQEAYDTLKLLWSQAEDQYRSACIRGAEKAPNYNYYNLLNCIAPTLDVTRARTAPAFRP